MSKKRRGILEGHKKVGTKFIPPMKQLPKMQELSFVDDFLPELIWIGLINDRVGYRAGMRIFEKIVQHANSIRTAEEPFKNFALLRSYEELSDDQKQQLLRLLEQEHMLDSLRDYLAPVILLYDGCPLSFLGPPNTLIPESTLVTRMQRCVGAHMDRYETPGIVLYIHALYAMAIVGAMHFPRNFEMPNFDAVIDAPESEDAKRAAGFARSSVMAEFGYRGPHPTWPRKFWNRGATISPCVTDASWVIDYE